MCSISYFDKDLLIERYVDDIVGNMHFLEIKEKLKEYLLDEKKQMSLDDLEIEILREDPKLINELYFEYMMEEV